MSTLPRPAHPSLRERLMASRRILIKEIAAFGVVGAVGFVVQIGLFNLLFHHHFGPLISNAIAVPVATVVTYVGNRKVSFSHRARTGLAREAGYFFGINAIAFVFSEVLFAIFAYPLHDKSDAVVMNVVNLVGIGIGTIFRFWSYKRFVFLHPDRVASADPVVEQDPLAA